MRDHKKYQLKPIDFIAPLLVFAVFFSTVYTVVRCRPDLGDDQTEFTFFPSSTEGIRNLYAAVAKYKDNHLSWLLLFFCSVYLFKQCFCIPGSALLNALAGALFGLTWAFPLVCMLTAAGASMCYVMSLMFGRKLGRALIPDKLDRMETLLLANQADIFSFMMFLRMFPFTPNFLINLSSPMVGVPFPSFFGSVLFGLMPYNFVCVQAGLTLESLTSMNDVFTWDTLMKLFFIACGSVGPKLLKKRWEKRFENLSQKED